MANIFSFIFSFLSPFGFFIRVYRPLSFVWTFFFYFFYLRLFFSGLVFFRGTLFMTQHLSRSHLPHPLFFFRHPLETVSVCFSLSLSRDTYVVLRRRATVVIIRGSPLYNELPEIYARFVSRLAYNRAANYFQLARPCAPSHNFLAPFSVRGPCRVSSSLPILSPFHPSSHPLFLPSFLPLFSLFSSFLLFLFFFYSFHYYLFIFPSTSALSNGRMIIVGSRRSVVVHIVTRIYEFSPRIGQLSSSWTPKEEFTIWFWISASR